MPVNATSLFPMPNVTNITGFFGYGNSVTNDMFTPFIVFGFFIVCFVALKNYPTGKAFAASSFVTFIMSLGFWGAGLLADYVIIVTVLMVGFSVFLIRKSGE